jgi:hypothetical protein
MLLVKHAKGRVKNQARYLTQFDGFSTLEIFPARRA